MAYEVNGRIDFGDLDPKINQAYMRLIIRAMIDGIDNDMIFGGMLNTGSAQDIHEVSTTQKYELGTRRITPDGRVHRYALAGTGGVYPGFGAAITDAIALSEALHVSAVAGATEIIMDQNAIHKDVWKGGYIVLGSEAGATCQNRMITGNGNHDDGETNHVIVTLDRPLLAAVTTGVTYTEILLNPYGNLKQIVASGNSFATFMGVPAAACPAASYFWLQTWGICWVCPGGGDAPGDAASERTVYFVADGSINGAGAAISIEAGYQKAGTIVEYSAAGAGPPMTMLQISP